MNVVVQEEETHVKDAGNAKDVGNVNDGNVVFRRFPAHDELGICRTSLASSEQPKW